MKAIISGVNRKGGSGKTTLIYNLAGILAQRGQPVTILDSDPQKSLYTAWERRKKDIPVEVLAVNKDFDLKHPAFSESGYTFIDTPPGTDESVRRAFAVSDIAVIPIKASPFDLSASLSLVDMAAEAREVNPGLKTLWVINQIKRGTVIANIIRRAAIERDHLPVANTEIPDTVVLTESVVVGLPLCFYQPGHAVNMYFKKLVKEILSHVEKR